MEIQTSQTAFAETKYSSVNNYHQQPLGCKLVLKISTDLDFLYIKAPWQKELKKAGGILIPWSGFDP